MNKKGLKWLLCDSNSLYYGYCSVYYVKRSFGFVSPLLVVSSTSLLNTSVQGMAWDLVLPLLLLL
jgi:hypothetical protein